ncbi:MAG TPA: hypothetical protein VKG45_16595 [Actinomycetes bacterium]|nr:hypothetical protein [Actinomycetes bacterium]
MTWRRPSVPRRAGPLAAVLAGAAASTFTTSVAAGVAGFQADRDLQPLEFTIRACLLLAAPGIGAMLAMLVLPRRAGRPPSWAVGLGVVVGPLLVLRLDRMLGYGATAALVTAALLAAWAFVGTELAARSTARADPGASWTRLPPPEEGRRVLPEASGRPSPE